MDHSSWGHKESDTTEKLTLQLKSNQQVPTVGLPLFMTTAIS